MIPIYLWVKKYKNLENFHLNLDSGYKVSLEFGQGKVRKNNPINEKGGISFLENSPYFKEAQALSTIKIPNNITVFKETQNIVSCLSNYVIKDLKIEKLRKEEKINFYGDNIDGINLLLGRNGSGKSSILEVLAKDFNSITDIEYIIIYKVDDLFLLEASFKDFPEDHFNFIKDYPNSKNVGEIPHRNFSVFLNGENEFVEFGPKYMKIPLKKGVIGRFKSNLDDNNNSREYRVGSRIRRYNYDLNEISYEYVHKFLMDMKNEKEYENIVMTLEFKNIFSNLTIDESLKMEGESNESLINRLSIYDDENEEDFIEKINMRYCNYIFLESYLNNIPKDVIMDLRGKVIEKSRSDALKMLETFLKKYNKKNVNDLFESYKSFIIQLKLILDRSKEDIILDNQKIQFNLKDKNNDLEKLFKIYDKWNSKNVRKSHLNALFEIKIDRVSDGERSFIKLFSSVYKFINWDTENTKFVTLLFDEIESYLHPEWCRNIMFKILKNLSNEKKKKIKLIFASHSPFLASDILIEDIVFLESSNGVCTLKSKEKINKTFGSNIHSLLKENFFMESTFGEFARNKIRDIIQKIENPEVSYEELMKVRFVIENIGEQLIRNRLNKLLDEKIKTIEEVKHLEKHILDLQKRLHMLKEMK